APAKVGEADDVEAALDVVLFESTLVRDAAIAGAASARDAANARESWANAVRGLRERRAVHALRSNLHPSERCERLRLLAQALDALGDEPAPPVPVGRASSAPVAPIVPALVQIARREESTLADRTLAIALAVAMEGEMTAGRYDEIDAFAALTQLPP